MPREYTFGPDVSVLLPGRAAADPEVCRLGGRDMLPVQVAHVMDALRMFF